MSDETNTQSLGPNEWLVDEMYSRFLASPDSVGESWQEFFEDYQPARAGERAPTDTANRRVENTHA